MFLAIAYIKSNSQVLINSIGDSTQLIDIESLKDQDLRAIFVPKILNQDEILSILEKESQYCPVIEADNYFNNIEQFEQLEQESAKKMVLSLFQKWIVQNNLSLVREIFKTRDHLRHLWLNDRTSFAEELWFILRNNLGTQKLSLIFNDVKTPKKERERSQLVRINITGTKIPEPTTGGEMETALLANYENDFHPHLEIVEYIKDQGKLVATMSINKSPLLIIAELFDVTSLQQNVLFALFEGLQDSLE